MTKALRAASGKNVEDNMNAEETLALLQKIADTGLLEKPMRVRKVVDNGDFWGETETDWSEDGKEVNGHDVKLTRLNDGLLLHEAAHAIAAEQLTFEEAQELDPHGILFQEALTTLMKRIGE